MTEKNSTVISVNKKTLIELRDLVDRRESDSNNTIINKVIDEFNRMEAYLEQQGLLKCLHPEWFVKSEELNFNNIDKLCEDKKEVI